MNEGGPRNMRLQRRLAMQKTEISCRPGRLSGNLYSCWCRMADGRHHLAFPQFFLTAIAAGIGSDGIGSTQSQGKNKCCNLFHLLLSMLAIIRGNRVRPVVKNS